MTSGRGREGERTRTSVEVSKWVPEATSMMAKPSGSLPGQLGRAEGRRRVLSTMLHCSRPHVRTPRAASSFEMEAAKAHISWEPSSAQDRYQLLSGQRTRGRAGSRSTVVAVAHLVDYPVKRERCLERRLALSGTKPPGASHATSLLGHRGWSRPFIHFIPHVLVDCSRLDTSRRVLGPRCSRHGPHDLDEPSLGRKTGGYLSATRISMTAGDGQRCRRAALKPARWTMVDLTCG
jgi:hypothetical protein